MAMNDLGLEHQAREHFWSLLKDRGYAYSCSGPYEVRYESGVVVVQIVFDGERSYELGLLLSKKGGTKGAPPFSIDEVLRLRGVPEAQQVSLIQITDQVGMAATIA